MWQKLDKIEELDGKTKHNLRFITETNKETDFSSKKGPIAFLMILKQMK